MEIFNNTTNVVRDDLVKTIAKGSRVSIAAACFSIYAYQELKAQLKDVESLRFIFTSPTFIAEKTPTEKREFYIPRLHREKSIYGTEFEIKLRNELTQKAIARECAAWIQKKATFKSNTTRDGMNNFINVESAAERYTYMPVNSFTTVDLGCERGNNISNMVSRMEFPSSAAFIEVFDAVWKDAARLQDVTQFVIESISAVYQENTPELVYYSPSEYTPSLFSSLTDNIKEDRTPEDLLFQVMLDLGVLLSSKIEETIVAGKKVFSVADGYLIACFNEDITDETIKEIAQKKPYYFVMRDGGYASDSVATNFDQIFAAYSPSTIRKVL